MARERICGIYCIENLINGKKYIGQSNNIYKRWKSHIKELNNNCHCNNYFQKAWNKYGEDNFYFNVLENCKENELNEKEIYYISKYSTYKSGYNLTLGGGGRRGYHLTDKQKEAIKNGRHDFKHSEETKRYISEIQIGRKLTDECKEKISKIHKKNIEDGKWFPKIENFKEHILESMTPLSCFNNEGLLVKTYNNIHEAGRDLHIEPTNICKVMKRKAKTTGGYTFTYLNENISIEELKNRFVIERCKDVHSSKYNTINLIDNDGNIIKTYQNAKCISVELGIDSSSIIKVCRGKLKQTKGYKFEYAS